MYYCYTIKHQVNQKPLLPWHYTISKLNEPWYQKYTVEWKVMTIKFVYVIILTM